MVQINEDEKAASDRTRLPALACNRERGDRMRLAAKLTGWKIDIKSQSQTEQEVFGEAFANADTSFDSMAGEFGIVDQLNEEEAVEEVEEDIILDNFAADDQNPEEDK